MENNTLLREIVVKKFLPINDSFELQEVIDSVKLNEAMIEWAVAQLLEGKTSPSLVLLAGMSNKDNFYDVEKYFLKAIQEMGITLPNAEEVTQEFLRSNARKICSLIINNEISPLDGSYLLENINDAAHYCDLNGAGNSNLKNELQAWYIINMRYGWAFDTLDEATFKQFENEVREAALAYLEQKPYIAHVEQKPTIIEKYVYSLFPLSFTHSFIVYCLLQTFGYVMCSLFRLPEVSLLLKYTGTSLYTLYLLHRHPKHSLVLMIIAGAILLFGFVLARYFGVIH